MTLKRRLPLEGKLLDSTTTRLHEHCITNRMMESSSAAYHIKRRRKHSKRLMMVRAELTNLVQSLKIDSKYCDIIGQRWSLTPSLSLSDAIPVRSMATSFIGTRTSSSYDFFLAIWDVGNGRGWSYLPTFIQRTSVYLSYNWLLFQMGGGYPSEGSEDICPDQVYQTSHDLPLWRATTDRPR